MPEPADVIDAGVRQGVSLTGRAARDRAIPAAAAAGCELGPYAGGRVARPLSSKFCAAAGEAARLAEDL